ncbi:MAG: zinc ribbon domain-containing protein [Planctomycetaceae bacterium]|nr:zinc ribbon domain-containing protein [Planctomycetaceae bacterium]
MLLVWGSGGGRAVLGELPEEHCDACGEKSIATAFVEYKYWHLWYLFSFLVGRKYFKTCTACGSTVPYDKTEAKLHFPKDTVPFIRKKGWLVVALLIFSFVFVGAVGSWRNRAALSSMIAEPKMMDLYYADLSKVENSGYRQGGPSVYGIMALIEERDDGTFLVATSTQAYAKKSQLEKEVKNDSIHCTYDDEDPLICSREQLENLVKGKIIYDGKRLSLEPPARE